MGHGNIPWCYAWGALLIGVILLGSCSTGGDTATSQIAHTPNSNNRAISTIVESPTPSPPLSCEMVTIANPAATYCAMLGYQDGMQTTSGGQRSACTMPDGTICDAWQFFRGTCGQEFSWCALNGYQIQNVIESEGSSTREYAICVDADGNTIGTVIELSGLQSLLERCSPR